MLNQSLGLDSEARVSLTDLIRYGMQAEIYKGHQSGDLLGIKDRGEEWLFVISTLRLDKVEKFHIISALMRQDKRVQMNIERISNLKRIKKELDDLTIRDRKIKAIDDEIKLYKNRIAFVMTCYKEMFKTEGDEPRTIDNEIRAYEVKKGLAPEESINFVHYDSEEDDPSNW